MEIPKLKTVLYANAIFCSVSAGVILVAPGLLAQHVINLPVIVFMILGIGLMVFALDVFMTARKPAVTTGRALYIFCADVAWVVLTPVVMLLLATVLDSSLLHWSVPSDKSRTMQRVVMPLKHRVITVNNSVLPPPVG